jgi:hypothetical protein
VWDRSQLVSANEIGSVVVSDLFSGDAAGGFKLADVVEDFSFGNGSSVCDFFIDGPTCIFTYHSGVHHWDLRQPPSTVRSLGVQGLGFQHVSAERDGHKLLTSCRDLDGVSTDGRFLVLYDRRSLKRPLAKAAAGQKVCKVHIDSAKIVISSDHRHSICGGSTFSVFNNELESQTASMCTGLTFQSNRGGGGESTIDPFVVDVSDTMLVGANCTGSIVHVWDLEPTRPPAPLFAYQDFFEPKQPLVMPRLVEAASTAALHTSDTVAVAECRPFRSGSHGRFLSPSISTPAGTQYPPRAHASRESALEARPARRRRSFSPTRNQGGVILF